MLRRRALPVAVLAAALTATAAPAAHADRPATAKEAKAIKKAFLKGRDGRTTVTKVRVSTVDRRYAAVTYRADVPEPTATAAKAVKVPSPAVVKKGKAGWRTVPTAPAKVRKDLKDRARSDLRLSGAVSHHFTGAASCTVSGDFYGASLYDRTSGTYFSVQIPTWRGYRWYPALAVHSLATVSVGDTTTPQYETGQAADAFAPSGALFVDPGAWGLIEADLHHVIDGSGATGTVSASGTWDCR